MTDNQNIERDAPQGAGGTSEPQRIEDLPGWAQALIRETRNEAADRRHRLSELETQQRAAEEKRLAEQQEWQKLAEQRKAEIDALQPYKEQVESVTATLTALLNAQLERLPEDVRAMVNELPLSPQQKLDWLAKNAARLGRPSPPPPDGGLRGDVTGGPDVPLDPLEEIARKQSGLSLEKWREYRQKRRVEADREPDLITRLRSMNQE